MFTYQVPGTVAEINLIVFLFFRLFKSRNSREQNFFDDKISFFFMLCRNPDNVNRNLSDLATFQVMQVILERLSKK